MNNTLFGIIQYLKHLVENNLHGEFYWKNEREYMDIQHFYPTLRIEVGDEIVYHDREKIHVEDMQGDGIKNKMIQHLFDRLIISGLGAMLLETITTIPPSLPKEYHPDSINFDKGREAFLYLKKDFKLLHESAKKGYPVFLRAMDIDHQQKCLDLLNTFINQVYIKYYDEH